MTYIDGFILAVPTANKPAYLDHATKMAPLLKEFGATRMVENWGDEVPDGKVTDFRRGTKAGTDEAVLFSWMEWPDKAARDAGVKKMMSDPRMADMGEMPFDGKRMVYGGFQSEVDDGPGGAVGYVEGFLVPVSSARKQDYFDMAGKAAIVFREHGATRVVEAWGDDVPDGKVTDFRRAVQATDGEHVVFSWCEWPDKAARDTGMKAVMEDARMKTPAAELPFDGPRMVYGGFATILDA